MKNWWQLFLLMTFLASNVKAEAFGNNAVFLPKIGAAFFDDPFQINPKPWGISHQYNISVNFQQAVDYDWWWLAETSFLIGPLNKKNAGSYISAVAGGVGVRYNFLASDFRPFAGSLIHYLQLVGANAKLLDLNLGWPIFVGLKPFVGVEWIFYSEMALNAELAYGLYVNLNEPFRQVWYTNLSFVIYF